jgi:hypothetical protein
MGKLFHTDVYSDIQAPSQPPPAACAATFLSDFIHRSQEPTCKDSQIDALTRV